MFIQNSNLDGPLITHQPSSERLEGLMASQQEGKSKSNYITRWAYFYLSQLAQTANTSPFSSSANPNKILEVVQFEKLLFISYRTQQRTSICFSKLESIA